MTDSNLSLPEDPEQALALLRQASQSEPILVFKKSPICPISDAAEEQFDRFLASHPDLQALRVDVLARRGLARGLTAKLGITHESPQGLLFRDGELAWHASHGDLTEKAFESALGS